MENKNIYEKLLEVKKSVEHIQKKKVGENLSYKAVSSSMVLGEINRELNKQGLFLKTQVLSKDVKRLERTKMYDGKASISYDFIATIDLEYTWINTDNITEKDINLFSCSGLNTDPSKAFGSALTYAEKYFYLKYFNISTDESDVDTFKQSHEDEDEKRERKAKLEAEELEKERIALKQAEERKIAYEKEKIAKELLEAQEIESKRVNYLFKVDTQLCVLGESGISSTAYYEYVKKNITDKKPNLLKDDEFNAIVSKHSPKPENRENLAKQSVNKFDKCNECKNETEFCICDIDKKAPVLAKV